jgi:amino-acid N-acetyltransferase
MTTNLSFLPATGRDAEAIAQLLQSYSLPSADFIPHLQHFIVARRGDEVLGCIGLESGGKLGLLRSLAVRSDARNQGIAARLCAQLERNAAELGIENLFLLTITAAEYFQKHGYQIERREDAPDWIRSNAQFRTLCASTAVLMRKELNRKGSA